MFKKLTLIALCLCLACGAVFCALQSVSAPEVTADRSIETVDEEIKACEALISRLNSELATLKEQIASVEGDSADTLEQAELLAAQVAILETQIELNETLLQSCDMKRATAQAELLLVRNEYEYYNELFAELMRFIYENGTTNDFELLFTSDSLSDYLSKRDNFNSIMECIDDLRASMEQSLYKLTDLEEEYALVSEKYETYLATLENDKKQLDASIKDLQELADNLNIESETLSGKYSELSANITEAKNKLTALKAEREEIYNSMIEENNPSYEPVEGGFIWPLDRNVSYRISSHYSTRTNPITGVGTEFHSGLDVACAKGSPILAAAGGVVTKSAWYGGYGNCVIVYHGQDARGRAVTTLYGHASALKCVEGQNVKQGDIIALVGTTGRSTGNHLHFSVLLDGVYVDPDDYLPDGYYTKLPNAG